MTSDGKSLEEKPTEEEMKPDPAGADEEKLEESSDKEGAKSEGEEDKPSSKKGRKREKKEVLPVTPTIERPTRERKVVERYTESSGARNASPKPLTFEKGRGTPLRDIPNVAFLLSKKKADDNLQMLHTILFGRKSKTNMLKRNIGMFSGFVWTESEEEKQRGKLKEKLDKLVKDKLFYFCDVLNIPANKTSSRKEELSAKLLEFLESPHPTTDVLLAEKDKKGKRKIEKASARRTSGSSGKSAKKQKNSSAGEKHKHSSKSEDEEVDDTIEHSDSEEDSSGDDEGDMVAKAESDQEQSSSDEDGEEHEEPKKLKHSEINSSKKSTKKLSEVHAKEKSKVVEKDAPVESPKSSNKRSKPMKVASASKSPKKQKVEKDSGKAEDEANEKALSKSSAKVPKSDQGKGKSDKKVTKEEPSKEEMHGVVVSILKKVDFNTATLSDILRQLGDHFGVDLMHRKAEVKAIITEAINNMTDEEDAEDEEDEGSEGGSDLGKDEDNADA